jgi:dipeptide/tripeptide permease
MGSLVTAFILNHFDAGAGWWVAFGAVIVLEVVTIVVKINRNQGE